MDASIYIPEESKNVFRYHINQLTDRSSNSWSYYHNVDIFKASARGQKIACFQIPYPYSDKIEQQISEVYDFADEILIIGSELHDRTVDFIKRHDLEKITYFICGELDHDMTNARVQMFLDWFTTSVHFYKNVKPSMLFDLDPYGPKPLMFDALLGRKKPHRDTAYQFINESGISEQGVVTYINDYQVNFDSTDSDKWIWQSEGIDNFEERAKSIDFTVDRVDYNGYSMSLSQIIPIDIYNRTAYSLVCETNFDNGFVFLTEKTVKPILARRLFITLGNRYHLAFLRKLGFKTYNSIIDETYDTIENPHERQLAAMAQLKWLCEQDQEEILQKIKPIADHNFNVMYGTNWYNIFRMEFGDHFFDPRSRVI